jgi:hypothetical protein
MQKAFGRAVDAETSKLRLLHRVGDHASALAAARRALAGNGTKQRAPCTRSCSKYRLASCC